MSRLLAVLMFVMVAGFALADTPQPAGATGTMGPRGGCYIVVTSKKTGKQYRKYVSKDQCKPKGATK